jgi:hypothetical protein
MVFELITHLVASLAALFVALSSILDPIGSTALPVARAWSIISTGSLSGGRSFTAAGTSRLLARAGAIVQERTGGSAGSNPRSRTRARACAPAGLLEIEEVI